MMMLPTNREALTKAIDSFVAEAESRYTPKFLQMALAYLYVQGHRDMRLVGLHSGEILFNRVNTDTGRLKVIDNRVQTKYNRAVEHIEKLDFAPVVSSEEIGLSSFRERAAAQVIIDAISDTYTTDRLKRQVAEIAPLYGGVGLLASVGHRDPIGFYGDYEVIPPWCIFPLPLSGMNLGSDSCGVMLRRFKTLSWMKERYKAKVNRNFEKMDVWRASPGVSPALSALDNDTSLSVRSLGNPGGTKKRGADETVEEICELREIWLQDSSGLVTRYIAVCGEWVIEDKDLSGEAVVCPLSYARYRNDGTFHGVGVPGVLMPLAVEAETLMSRLIEYAGDLDRFGFAFFPDTMVDVRQLQRGPHGLVIGRFDPTLTGNGRPYHFPPPTPTDIPGRVAASLGGLMDQMVPDPEILRGDAPGRVESPSALAMLNDAANSAVATGSDNIARMKGEADRYLVHEVSKRIVESGGGSGVAFPIKNLDISLVGAVISGGREEGTSLRLEFSQNPVPKVQKLRFTIKEKRPRLKEARRQEVALAFTQGRLAPVDFKIINYRENLELPMAQGIVAHSYMAATINSLALFNDGQTPGTAVLFNDLSGDHEVILHVIDELMAMPEFLFASQQVQEAFEAVKRDEMRLLGMVLPGSTPPVDESAMILREGENVINQLRQRAVQT